MQHTAKGIASLGRNGDDTLLHINKDELVGLQALLGPVSVNPDTGLPEAFEWTDLLKMIGVGVASAVTGGAAGGLMAPVVGAATGTVVGGAFDSMRGKGFSSNILGNAISGGISGFGASGLGGGNTAPVTDAVGTPGGITSQPISTAAANYNMPTGAGFNNPASYANPGQITGQSLTQATNTGLNSVERAASGVMAPGGADKMSQLGIEKFSLSPEGTTKAIITPERAASASQMPEPGSAGSVLDEYGKKLGAQWDKMMTKEGAEAAFKYGVPAVGIGLTLEGQNDAAAANKKAEQDQTLAGLKQDREDKKYFGDMGFGWSPNASQVGQTVGYGSGFAAGGPIDLSMQVGGEPINIQFPTRYADEFANSGAPQRLERLGIGGLGQGLEQQYANGGYVNTHPFDPQDFHPQSQIPSAQPYAGAAPTSVINTLSEGASFADGGFIEGPGDGMSDDIPANISGVEPVRVADGEFRWPAAAVARLGGGDAKKGAKILDAMLKHVRAQAYKDGHKGGQIKQDAGKLAAEKMFQRHTRHA